jgi:hypothetical protein
MPERTDIPIDALVVYRRTQAHPDLRSFSWPTRRVDVSRTNLVHAEREGETLYLVYSVSAGKDHFHLRLDTRLGRWTLEEIEVGN